MFLSRFKKLHFSGNFRSVVETAVSFLMLEFTNFPGACIVSFSPVAFAKLTSFAQQFREKMNKIGRMG